MASMFTQMISTFSTALTIIAGISLIVATSRSDSTGSSLAAFDAGRSPASTLIIMLIPSAITKARLSIFPNTSEYTGYTCNATIGDFFNNISSNYSDPYAILGGIYNSDNSSSSETVNDSFAADLLINLPAP